MKRGRLVALGFLVLVMLGWLEYHTWDMNSHCTMILGNLVCQ